MIENKFDKFVWSKLAFVVLGLELWCLNATFNNILVISWRSVLFVEKNHRPVTSHQQALSHVVLVMVVGSLSI